MSYLYFYFFFISGFVTNSEIEGMLSEILKMEAFSHPHVMNLIGVCISESPMIIMPYMANGNLLNYLKKERNNLYLDYDAEEDDVRKQISMYLYKYINN